MKKKSIYSFILAVALVANSGMSVYATDTTTKTTKKEAAVTTSTTQKQVSQQQTQMNMDIKTDSTDISQQYTASPNSMGNMMTNFNFNAMSAHNFTLPEMSGFTSEADMQEKYDKMIAGFTNFGFGKQASLPQNSGYSQSIVQSFSDQFGTGLASDFKNCQLTFNPNTVFNEAATKRNQLFGNLKNDKTYNLVQSNFNISGVMAKINSVHLDPNDVKTSLESPSTLEGKIRGTFDSKYNKVNALYSGEQSLHSENFSGDLDEVNKVKTRLSEQGNNWFDIDAGNGWKIDLRRRGANYYTNPNNNGESDYNNTLGAINQYAQEMSQSIAIDPNNIAKTALELFNPTEGKNEEYKEKYKSMKDSGIRNKINAFKQMGGDVTAGAAQLADFLYSSIWAENDISK